MTVQPGEKGIDFAFGRPPAQTVIAAGYTFVVGYLSMPPASSAKNMGKVEAVAYINAGLKVLYVWEMSANTANSGGAVGRTHGLEAKRQANAIGYPTDVAILCADDTNATPGNITAHEAYVRAFAAAISPYPLGVYGDIDICARVRDICALMWIPNAWSWSAGSRAQMEQAARALGAEVLQRTGFALAGKYNVDPNDVIAPFNAWSTQVTHDVTPPIGGERGDVFIVTNSEQRGDFGPNAWKFVLIFDGAKWTKWHLDELTYVTGHPEGARTNAQLDQIPDFAGMQTPGTTVTTLSGTWTVS